MAASADSERIAAELYTAARDGRTVRPPSGRFASFTLRDGYAVAGRLHERLLAEGWRTAGRKLGFTNPATWREFGLDTPIAAPVYRETVRFGGDDGSARLSLARAGAPRIEPEVVVALRGAPVDASLSAVTDAVDWLAIGVEIVDCHFPGWRFAAADAVADFGLHYGLVVGARWHPGAEERRGLHAALCRMAVTLHGDGEAVAHGRGENALGGPLKALAHLVELVDGGWAAALCPGEVVTTGTLTALPPVAAGQRWTVCPEGAPLQALEVTLTP